MSSRMCLRRRLASAVHRSALWGAGSAGILAAKIPALPAPQSADRWTAEARRLRRHILEDIAFHGWPREWAEAPLKLQDVGPVRPGQGYRLRKLRFEIV